MSSLSAPDIVKIKDICLVVSSRTDLHVDFVDVTSWSALDVVERKDTFVVVVVAVGARRS